MAPSGTPPGSDRRGSGSGTRAPGDARPIAGGGTGTGTDPRGGTGTGQCIKTGSFGEMCSDREQMTPNMWLNVYACYWSSKCERQSNGQCGWTQTNELNLCVELFKLFQA
jgi:hypothetical protein